MATMGKTAYVATEVGEERKRLSKSEQEALLEEATRRLQETAPADSRASPGGGGPSVSADDQSENHWQNLKLPIWRSFWLLIPCRKTNLPSWLNWSMSWMSRSLTATMHRSESSMERQAIFLQKAELEINSGNVVIQDLVEEATVVENV